MNNQVYKEKLTEYVRNRSYPKNGKAKSKRYFENNKESMQKKKHENVTGIFLKKKKATKKIWQKLIQKYV